MNSKLETLIDSTLKNIKNMVDVDSIIGNPIIAGDDTTIIPVSKVAFGFGGGGSSFGGSETKEKTDTENFGGGMGGGVTISPVAFLIVSGSSVKMINVDQSSPIDRLVDMAPDVINRVISSFPKKEAKAEATEE